MKRHVSLKWVILLMFGSSFSATGAPICAAGAFFNGLRCQLCPGGTYGVRPGLESSTCSGKCSAGYFCPDGSTSPYQNHCGTSVFYCPQGSAMRQRLTEGYYTLRFPEQIPTQNLSAITQTACEPGYYCVFGIRRACPVGRFGQTIRLKSVTCTDSCPMGFYCPLATPLPIPCPAGTYGNVTELSSSICSGQCPLGHYWYVANPSLATITGCNTVVMLMLQSGRDNRAYTMSIRHVRQLDGSHNEGVLLPVRGQQHHQSVVLSSIPVSVWILLPSCHHDTSGVRKHRGFLSERVRHSNAGLCGVLHHLDTVCWVHGTSGLEYNRSSCGQNR